MKKALRMMQEMQAFLAERWIDAHEDGTPVVEVSLRIEIAGDGIKPKVTSLIDSLKEMFNQESVMLSETESAVSFV